MAETKKKKKIVAADSGKEVEAGSRRRKKAAEPTGSSIGYRIGAFVHAIHGRCGRRLRRGD